MSQVSQAEFFKGIKEILSPEVSLVDELADLLGITNDGIYRRLRGETQLTYNEIQKICAHFNVPFNSGSGGPSVSFQYARLGNEEDSFYQYLSDLCSKLEAVKGIPGTTAVFAAESMPLFYHFLYPELTRFKVYFWSKAVMGITALKNVTYGDYTVPASITDAASRGLKLYNSIPCTEVWNDNTIEGTLKQIEFYWETGVFPTKTDALNVCSETIAMLDHIEEQAASGGKFMPGMAHLEDTFRLYTSDVALGCNCIYVKAGSFRQCFFAPHTFNSIITSNQEFCDDTEAWLTGLMGKSTLISGTAEKQRSLFFNRKRERISKLMEKIG